MYFSSYVRSFSSNQSMVQSSLFNQSDHSKYQVELITVTNIRVNNHVFDRVVNFACGFLRQKGLVILSAYTNESHSSGTVSPSRWKKIWGRRIFATL